MTNFNFNDIKSQFISTFPSASFNKVLDAELEKAERSYNNLVEEFNNGIYNEHNSNCNCIRVAIQHALEKDKIVELLEKYGNFDMVFDTTTNMWCIESKSYVFSSESVSTTAIKKVAGYINRKNELIKKYDFSLYNSSPSELKFDISRGVSSIKNYTKFTYTEEFIMKKLASKFNSLFPQYNFVKLLNSVYDHSVLIVEKYETEFNNGNYSWSNSKLIETFEFIPSSISSENLKAFVNKYDNFVIGGENEELGYNQCLTIKKYVMEIESPEYITIMRVIGLISDFIKDSKELSEIDQYISNFS